MSTSIKGFIPPDDKWKKMKAIYDACRVAKINLPDEVEDFFDGEKPDENGQIVEIPHTEYQDDYSQGIEVEIAKLPKNVKVIRFYNSW
jgi:hypothetical protein